MTRSPYSAEGLQLARDTLTDVETIRRWAPDQRRQLVEMAQAILQADRAHRLGLDPNAPRGPARVLTIPRAVFQAGLSRRRHRLRIVPGGTFTPGDAA